IDPDCMSPSPRHRSADEPRSSGFVSLECDPHNNTAGETPEDDGRGVNGHRRRRRKRRRSQNFIAAEMRFVGYCSTCWITVSHRFYIEKCGKLSILILL
uniref:Uncharacterized protein n=1 Tax=Caenorhabditis japonica TaxID=281687 RepID=A0A8R1IT87_CAEJA